MVPVLKVLQAEVQGCQVGDKRRVPVLTSSKDAAMNSDRHGRQVQGKCGRSW